MRGYFAIFNDTLFELVAHKMDCRSVRSNVEKSAVTVNTDDKTREASIGVTISNVRCNASSNGETYKDIVCKIDNHDITSVTELSPVYRMYVEYEITEVGQQTSGCRNIFVRDIPMSNEYIELGLDDNNELLSKMLMRAECKSETRYSQHIPFGISTPRHPVELHIHSIKLVATKLEGYADEMDLESIRVKRRKKPFERVPHNPMDRDMMTYQFKPFSYIYCGDGTPIQRHHSIQEIHNKLTIDHSNEVVIYDNVSAGNVIDPIRIGFVPLNLTIRVNIQLDNYLVVADPSDIYDHFKENEEIVIPIGPGENTDEDTGNDGEGVENPNDTPDVNPPISDDSGDSDSSNENDSSVDDGENNEGTTDPSEETVTNPEDTTLESGEENS